MKAYLDLLRDIRDNGEGHDDRTGVGTLSVFGRQIRMRLTEGFPLLTTKKLPLRWIAEELFWFLSGSTNEKDLAARGVDIWKEWATAEACAKFGRAEGDLGPVYGRLWRSFPRLTPGNFDDQIQNLYDDLTNSPNSRRLIVTGWHPQLQKQVALPPCHTLWQVKVHPQVTYRRNSATHWEDVSGEGLSLHLYARSIDSFLGLPFNIASYALLLSLLAHTTGRIAWDLIISFGDVHIYKNHLAQVNEQLSREPRPLPQLLVNERLHRGGLQALLDCKWEDLKLYNYKPHGKIEAEVAV